VTSETSQGQDTSLRRSLRISHASCKYVHGLSYVAESGAKTTLLGFISRLEYRPKEVVAIAFNSEDCGRPQLSCSVGSSTRKCPSFPEQKDGAAYRQPAGEPPQLARACHVLYGTPLGARAPDTTKQAPVPEGPDSCPVEHYLLGPEGRDLENLISAL